MKIAGSFLQIQDDKKRIKWLNDVCDFIHYDIMDGLFTDKATIANDLLLENTACVTKGKDVHLMVLDVKKYADIYSKVNPDIIIFHYEATSDIMENIMYIKNKGIGVGLAINPETDVRVLDNYLNKLDMVLVMSVQAGASGQTFIDITDKIDYLILTHPDEDHVGGALSLINDISVGQLFVPLVYSRELFPVYNSVINLCEEKQIPMVVSERNAIEKGEDFSVSILAPARWSDNQTSPCRPFSTYCTPGSSLPQIDTLRSDSDISYS